MDQLTLGTRNVSLEFPGVKALSNVDFEITTGEIRAVVGANGAGKSTLMKVLAGANPDYMGEVYLGDKTVDLRTTMAAKKLGIQIVYQEIDTALVPTLSVAENVMLSHMVVETHGHPMLDWNKLRRQAQEVLDRLHISVSVRTLVQNLSLAQKQMVLIAKAVVSKCNFLILDEPTAPLSDTETAELFRLVKHLRETQNIAIVFISHRINEVIQICEKYTVMRNGEIVDTAPITGATTTREIVEKMLGRTFEETFRREHVPIGEAASFQVSHLSGAAGKVNDVSIHVKKGEIVGIAGLVGAGKSELCKTIFGAYAKTGGSISLDGATLKIATPSHAVKNRIAFVPEERRKEGVLVHETVSFNLSAACLKNFCTASFIRKKKVDANAQRYVEDLGISTPSIRQLVKNLSGGNQQKVAVGKWMAADCDVYIFDEPTKGVDVGAKQDIFHLITEITKRGCSVIYASCENTELLSLTDRIYVLYDGKVMAELATAETNEDEIMYYAVGGKAVRA
ncbi:MAG: sugar ABC transporter ATP-binding protein [Oscillospiraceae bacterium]|jgi:simple sugar transport system ATP-binding protein|nr:sugar ABC transporter ATP-binding protein [Oscillospiraceae bacterium]